MVLTFKSADEILKCDHSNDSYLAVHSAVLFVILYKVVLTFESVDESIAKSDHSNESYCWSSIFLN